ncbi:MAG: prenyltransferase/squalene oxidase repeat-containing protein [Candidatus Helarchaeota archaeon]
MAVPWIPDFSYFEYKAKNPIKLGQSLKFIQQAISKDGAFKSLETLFWTTMLLSNLNKLNMLNREKVTKYIKTLKYEKGGYKFIPDSEEPDTWSTFYCIAIAKTLRLEDIIDEKDVEFILKSQILGFGSDGGFIHCNFKKCHADCNGKTSIKSTFYAVSTLIMLEKLDKIDKKRLSYFLKKETKDNIELIYQIMCMKLTNELESFNFEKKIPVILNWQIPKSGFGINSKFPTVEHTFWVGICFGLLGKLNLMDFGGVIDFLKAMQQDNGGFTDQYTSISSKRPTLLTTAKGIIILFFLWNRLIEMIENEILVCCRDFEEVYLFPIKDKFRVPIKLIEEIANWLISNKWIEGEIQDRQKIFEKYFQKQNKISQEIIRKVMKKTQSFKKQKELDLKEFSKQFDFSNPLERVKLVINDLLINKFITGNIRTQKKKYFLENYRHPGIFIQIKNPIPYKEIMEEKKRMSEDKQNLLKFRKQLIEFPGVILKIVKESIDKDNIEEATKLLDDYIKKSEEEILKFEKFMKSINSSYKFIDFKLYNFKFERNWAAIKQNIQDSLLENKSILEKLIKEKKEILKERSIKQKDQDDIRNLWGSFTNIKKKLNLYQVEIKNFFPKNYLNHEAILDLIKNINDYINESDQRIKSRILELDKSIQFDEFKKELKNLQKSWMKEFELKKALVNSYQIKIDKRIQIQKLIMQLISELEDFSKEKKIQINKIIDEEKLEDASNLLKECMKEFNELHSNQKESFKIFIDKINEEIPDFPKFSSDLEDEWNEKLKNEEEKWNQIKNELSGKLISSQELEKKDELDKKIEQNIEDIKKSIENLKETILELVKKDNVIDAGKNTKELKSSISEKIKAYDQEYRNFIKNTSKEFNKFRDTVSDLTEKWGSEREKLLQALEKTVEDLKEIINKKGSNIRKIELNKLIRSQISEINDKIKKFKLKYNQYVDSEKKLDDYEEILRNRLSRIEESIKISDERIKNFIKTALKIYDTFEENITEETDLWDKSKSEIKKKIDSLSKKISDEILIARIQTIAMAFKDYKVDINYLSKAVKVKLEQLKMDIIDLIAENKLIGEMDPSSNMFILKKERKPEIFSIEKEPEKKAIIEDIDPIKKEILKLRYLMVIHNRVGATVYNRQLGEWKLDPDLIGGFLTAIQSFGSEIKKEKETIKSMEYKGFEIVMEQGKYTLVALFIDGKESEWNRKKIKLFVEEFEKEFEEDLKNWMGEVSTFRRSGFLVDKVFELFRL